MELRPISLAAYDDGTIVVGSEDFCIYLVSPEGAVTHFAGQRNVGGYQDGPGADARFGLINGLAIRSDGNIVVCDYEGSIRLISPEGYVSTIAGSNEAGYKNGKGAEARFSGPFGIALNDQDEIFVSDSGNHSIRHIDRDGNVTTFLKGFRDGMRDGVGINAGLFYPSSLALTENGIIFLDNLGRSVRTVTMDGTVSTLYKSRRFNYALIVRDDGSIIFGGQQKIELIHDDEVVEMAGSLTGFKDGRGDEAEFEMIQGMCLKRTGEIVAADTPNSALRLIIDLNYDGVMTKAAR